MQALFNLISRTMLIERLSGVGVYTLVLFYFSHQIRCAVSYSVIKKYLNQYLIVLCIMSFFYIPGNDADLSRWRILAMPWMDRSFEWFWTNRVITSSTPAGYLFIYICQKTGLNGLLPAVCSAGFFGNMFYILRHESENNNVSGRSVSTALFFLMSSGCFLEVISGVRCMLAFSIVLRYTYDEIAHNKSILRSLPFYAVAMLLHSAVIPLVGIRMFCALFEKKRRLAYTLINILFVIGMAAVGIYIGGDYLDASFSKFESYTSSSSYSYIWEYFIGAITVLTIGWVVLRLKKRCPEKYKERTALIRLIALLFLVEAIFIGTYSIFHRFAAVLMFLSIPVVLDLLESEKCDGRIAMSQNLKVISVLLLLLACSRGNLCGYKFFLLS